jgi:hypothetical protein
MKDTNDFISISKSMSFTLAPLEISFLTGLVGNHSFTVTMKHSHSKIPNKSG